MEYHGTLSFLALLLTLAWCLAIPVPGGNVDNNVAKRTLEEFPGVQLPMFNPYGIYPGVKPLHPFLPPGLLINRFATLPPTLDPIATFFKSKKDEFLNKLFNDLTVVTDSPDISVRSVVDEADPTDDPSPTTPKPKIDPSVFITKKFDFLAQLFKALNTTTPAPSAPLDTTDPTGTTIKPTIVPPGFWVPFPKPPKPPKPSKPPKPEKTKTMLLNEIDEALLKSILASVNPNSPALTDAAKTTRGASSIYTRKASFLDQLLHRVTDATPTELPDSPITATDVASNSIETRSMFPPGYWIPPYIYAAKMGIYLDKIFDTLDKAAAADSNDPSKKRSVAASETDPSSIILNELMSLKNDMVTAFAEGVKSAKAASTPKPTPKSFKKPFWGPKTTPTPDPVQQKVDLLSQVFDKLAAVGQQLATGSVANATTEAFTTTISTTPTTADFWAPDPAAPDISEYYKTKTQEFLTQLFADKASSAPATEA